MTSAELSAIAGIELAEGFTLDAPACVGETCVCGRRGDEIARGTFWLHPQCVRLGAARASAWKVRVLTELEAERIRGG